MDIKKKIILNSTEGGAKIKGTIQLSLKEVIEKYCQEPIDKSIIKPLLSPADDGDSLIKKVIPLLKNDIDGLNEIITNGRKGIAVSHGIKTLISRPEYTKLLPKKQRILFDKLNKEATKEGQGNPTIITQLFFLKVIKKLQRSRLKTIMIMSHKNFTFSESAHIAAIKNHLINVAVYGASRQIQTRDLKVDSGINHFLMNQKDAIIRTERNMIILKAAKTAAESLEKSYKKTLKLLKKYHKTKDESLLTSSKIEPINLDDAEDYFKAGNWAHPLLDAKKILESGHCELKPQLSNSSKSYLASTKYDLLQACEVHDKALKMKQEAIQKAKKDETKYHDKMTKLVKYNDLLEQAKDAGRLDKDFDKALKLMKEAIKLMPEEQEARWGLASALHHTNQLKESEKEYRKLVKDFPDKYLYQFELGQVLLRDNQLQEGLKEIGEVMKKTEEFDNFLARLGDIYLEGNMYEEALIVYTSYLKKFPFDFKIWTKKGTCLTALNRPKLAEKAYQKALEIKPDLKT